MCASSARCFVCPPFPVLLCSLWLAQLWLACAQALPSIASMLLTHGADWTCEVGGISALDAAALNGHQPVAETLVNFALTTVEGGVGSVVVGRRAGQHWPLRPSMRPASASATGSVTGSATPASSEETQGPVAQAGSVHTGTALPTGALGGAAPAPTPASVSAAPSASVTIGGGGRVGTIHV